MAVNCTTHGLTQVTVPPGDSRVLLDPPCCSKTTRQKSLQGSTLAQGSCLNYSIIAADLASYWDQKLLDIVQYGAPLLTPAPTEPVFNKNHKSGILAQMTNSQRVWYRDLIADSLKRQWIKRLGHHGKPGEELTKEGWLHILQQYNQHRTAYKSSIALIPKKSIFRKIDNMSAPKRSKAAKNSTNGRLQFKVFLQYVTLLTVLHMAKAILATGESVYGFKIDLSNAYGHISTTPELAFASTFSVANVLYCPNVMTFGWSPAAQLCTRLTNAFQWHLLRVFKEKFYAATMLDDTIFLGSKQQLARLKPVVLKHAKRWGLQINMKKLEDEGHITQDPIWLGLMFDFLNDLLILTAEKRIKYIHKLKQYLSQANATVNTTEKILGILFYSAVVIISGRSQLFATRAFLKLLRVKHYLPIPREVVAELEWWLDVLASKNTLQYSIPMFTKHKPEFLATLGADSCLTGTGGSFLWNHKLYGWAHQFPTNKQPNKNIHLKEFIGLIITLEAICSLVSQPNGHFQIYTDSKSCFHTLLSRTSNTCPYVAALLPTFFKILAQGNHTFEISHYPGELNFINDRLSRQGFGYVRRIATLAHSSISKISINSALLNLCLTQVSED